MRDALAPRPRLGGRAALLLAFVAVVPFLNGLNADFTYDDKVIIRDNPRLASPDRAGEIFTTHYFSNSLAAGTAYRPLVLLTYAVQRWAHGNRAILFRAVNVALHAATTVLLASWLLALGFPRAPVLAAGALFGAVTIHVEAVTGLVGRAEILAALLVLLSADLWRRATAAQGRLAPLPYAGCVLSFLAAVFVKESAIVVPGVVLLAEAFRGGTVATPFFRRMAATLRARALPLAGLLVPVAAVFAARRVVLKGFLFSKQAAIFDLDNPLVAFPPLVRIADASWLLLRYAAKTLVPVGLSADHSAYALPLAARLSEPLALAGLGGLLLLVAAAVLLARPRPAASFGILFFLGTFFPASNLPFAIGTVYAERLAYLPSAGLLLAVTTILTPRLRAVPRPTRIRWGALALAAALLAYGTATVLRNRVFANDRSLYEDMVSKMPRSAKARYNLGYDDQRRGDLTGAEAQLTEATRIFPRYYDAWAVLGSVLSKEKRWDQAIAAYRRSVQLLPSYENGRWGLAKTLEAAGRGGEAEKAFREALKALPDSYPLLYHYASFLDAARRHAEALPEWRKALRAGKEAPLSYLGLARCLAALGRDGEAVEEARQALVRSPGLVSARLFLAERYEADGKELAAGGELSRALASAPKDPAVATALLELGARQPRLKARVAARVPSILRAFGDPPREAAVARALALFRGA